MDTNTTHVASVFTGDINAGEPKVDVNRNYILERISSGVDIMKELGSAREVLTRIELDLACSSEKLVNLNILMMRVSTKESELEAFVSDEEHNFRDSGENALELDLLAGVLDSEVKELEYFMHTLQEEIVIAREIISPCTHWGENWKDMEENLNDSEESLRQSLEQISEIKVQSSNFQRILLSFGGEETFKDNGNVELVENSGFSKLNSKIKMQTSEQQRHVLRMLEKSLARELDLEKKVAESRQIEEDLKLRLHLSEHEVFSMEEEVEVAYERLFEGENIVEVLIGISKELLGRLQILQFNLNGSSQREEELRSKLQDSIEQLKAKDAALQKLESSSTELNEFLLSQTNTLKISLRETEDKLVLVDSEAFTLREKVSSLENQLKESEFHLMNAKISGDGNQDLLPQIHEMDSIHKDLKEKILKAESRAESAETNCKLLTEANMDLTEELNLLSGTTSDRIELLERQLRESDIQLQCAVASAEASQEQQSMLYSTTKDMESLIEDLKLKVAKAENQADSAEEKCIILSESNSDLNEELSFLRGRLESLTASLHEAEEKKKATAKDIRIRTKLIMDLVVQLAFERERLQKQISSLTKEKIIFLKHSSNPPVNMTHNSRGDMQHDTTVTSIRESREVARISHASSKQDKMPESGSTPEAESTSETSFDDSRSKFETIVRDIGARQLKIKYVFMAVLVLVISVFAASLYQHQDTQFT